jgi:hypothetical protein
MDIVEDRAMQRGSTRRRLQSAEQECNEGCDEFSEMRRLSAGGVCYSAVVMSGLREEQDYLLVLLSTRTGFQRGRAKLPRS